MARAALIAATVLAAALSFTSLAEAGWVKPPGAYYVKLWDRTLIGSQVFGLDGEKLELPAKYQDHALNLYVEYGATSELTIVFHSSPLGFAKYGDASTAYSGLSSLGLRVALLRGELPAAVELSYGYSPPLGAKPLAEGTVGGTAFYFRPTFEQHVLKAELQVGWAHDWFWTRGTAGTSFSTAEEIHSVVEASLSMGVSTGFGLAAGIQALYHTPTTAPTIIDVTGAGDTRYFGLNLGVSWWFTNHVALNASVGSVASAVSNAATPALCLGIEIRS